MYQLVPFLLVYMLVNMPMSAQIDTSYVQDYKDRVLVSSFYALRNFSIQIEPTTTAPFNIGTPVKSTLFSANTRHIVGLQVAYRGIVLAAGFKAPNNYANDAYTDINVQIARPKVFAAATYKKYESFSALSMGLLTRRLSRTTVPPDFFATYANVQAIYIVNPSVFSFQSAYNFIKRQKRSAASFMCLVIGNYTNFQIPNALIPLENNGINNAISHMQTLGAIGMGIAPGYTTSLVHKNWFISGALFVGAMWQRNTFSIHENPAIFHEIRVSPLANTRLALGYHSDDFFAGINLVADYNYIDFSNMRSQTTYTNMSFRIGWRLQAPKLLQDSINNLPFIP